MLTPEESLLSEYGSTISERLKRWNSIARCPIIGNYYFSQASTECFMSFRDGHYIVTVMAVQAVNEGLIRFIADRNEIPKWHSKEDKVRCLVDGTHISPDCGIAMMEIIKCYRNDYHHMNPGVGFLKHFELSKRCLERLCVIENEIFSCSFLDGKIRPKQPKYWDFNNDGTIPAYIRTM